MATLTLLSMARCRTDDIHHTAQLLWTDCIVGKTNDAHRDDVGDVVAFKAQDVGCCVHVSDQKTRLDLTTIVFVFVFIFVFVFVCFQWEDPPSTL